MPNLLEYPTESEVILRMLAPDESEISPEAARFILSLRLHADDIARVNELSDKARAGTLKSAEQDELNGYERIGNMLGILQTKARLALAHARRGRNEP